MSGLGSVCLGEKSEAQSAGRVPDRGGREGPIRMSNMIAGLASRVWSPLSRVKSGEAWCCTELPRVAEMHPLNLRPWSNNG